jgi:hypothetical protein
MRELTAQEIQQVSGGEMSNRTAIIIGGTCLLFPIMGAGMAFGYYVRRH